MSIDLMRCASARSGGGIFTTSNAAEVVAADRLALKPRYIVGHPDDTPRWAAKTAHLNSIGR